MTILQQTAKNDKIPLYMVRSETFFESHDGVKLNLYRWTCEQSVKTKAVLHIVHGMAEHALRYNDLAEKLTLSGIEVWAADLRGHGKTADPKINPPSKGGLLGHCADKDSINAVTQDVHALNKTIRSTVPDVKVFLMGHSWGSFITQNYIEKYTYGLSDLLIDGCILSGTRGPGGFIIKAGVPFLTLLAFFCGQRNGSETARNMADGQYSKPFKPYRTQFDWLSRDTKEVDTYISDPLCGQLCSSGFYRDMAKLLNRIHRSKAMARIEKGLPIYVLSGNADPVGDMGASPTALVNAYRILGINDLEFVLYPGARHELINETNREEVVENLLTWINKHCE